MNPKPRSVHFRTVPRIVFSAMTSSLTRSHSAWNRQARLATPPKTGKFSLFLLPIHQKSGNISLIPKD
jgi:hypothetical protein